MDTRFSSAIHILIMIAGSEQPLTSEAIANSVGTNPSYIRKVTGLLKKKGILDSRQGIHGFSLLIPPENLSLTRPSLRRMRFTSLTCTRIPTLNASSDGISVRC